jgi:hypothetical protein
MIVFPVIPGFLRAMSSGAVAFAAVRIGNAFLRRIYQQDRAAPWTSPAANVAPRPAITSLDVQRGQSSTVGATHSIIGAVAPCIMRHELDLRLVDVAAFHASQGPVLKAGTRRDNALNCRTGLASRTARTLGGERRRLRIGHGIDPGQGHDCRLFKRNSGAGGSAAAAVNVSRRRPRDQLPSSPSQGRGPHLSGASVIAGGPAPLIATALFATYHSGYAISIYIAACAVVSLVATAMMPDYTGQDISMEYDD